MIRGFVIGVIATVAVAAGAAFATVRLGLLPAGADQKPPAIERWAAKTSLHAAMRRNTPNLHDPLPLTDANLSAGVKLSTRRPPFCHGAADKQASTAAKGFYISAPQLADDGVEDDPGGRDLLEDRARHSLYGDAGVREALDRRADVADHAVRRAHGQIAASRGYRVEEGPECGGATYQLASGPGRSAPRCFVVSSRARHTSPLEEPRETYPQAARPARRPRPRRVQFAAERH